MISFAEVSSFAAQAQCTPNKPIMARPQCVMNTVLQEGMLMNNDLLLLAHLNGNQSTANETINSIYRSDLANKISRMDWKFYLHLNKRFAPLFKQGLIQQVGTKKGPTNRIEKMWALTEAAVSLISFKESYQA